MSRNNDFNFTLTGDLTDQRASATVTVSDFEAMIEASATLDVTVTSFEDQDGTSATATIRVTDFEELQDNGSTITVGSDTIAESTDFDSETSNDVTATNIAEAIDALGDYSATASGDLVSIVVDAEGVAGNAITIEANDFALNGIILSGETFAGGTDAATLTIDGNELVAGTDWTPETDDDTTATNLATAIDLISGYSASATDNVVTVTYDTAGFAGNAKEASITGDGLTISGATFAGGQDNATITLEGTDYVQGTDFTAETDNDTTAGNLATALSAESGFIASATDNIVTIYWETPGVAGNAKTLAIGTNDLGVEISGETLSGGEDYAYSEWVNTTDAEKIEATLNVTALDGTTPTLDVTPQYSYDKVTAFDCAVTFTQAIGVTNETIAITNQLGNYMRFKFDLGGTDPVLTGTLQGNVR